MNKRIKKKHQFKYPKYSFVARGLYIRLNDYPISDYDNIIKNIKHAAHLVRTGKIKHDPENDSKAIIKMCEIMGITPSYYYNMYRIPEVDERHNRYSNKSVINNLQPKRQFWYHDPEIVRGGEHIKYKSQTVIDLRKFKKEE